jgi:hypothetical protein
MSSLCSKARWYWPFHRYHPWANWQNPLRQMRDESGRRLVRCACGLIKAEGQRNGKTASTR